MKKYLLLFLCLGSLFSYAQITTTTQWTWLKGDNTLNNPGVYGIQGTLNVANKPGAREGAVSWTDVSGNFYLFGGNGYASTATRGLMNDLWKYQVSTNSWVWLKGSNVIGDQGEYGSFGVSTATTRPGARKGSISWLDASGNLWLFGGDGLSPLNPQGLLNDLWRYSPSSNQWTWMNGEQNPDQPSEFGIKGVSAPGNVVGSRSGAVSWFSGVDELWLFGGLGYSVLGNSYANDLWRYDISTGEWTWMKGSDQFNQAGIYGTQMVANATNAPGSRHVSGNWKDASGNFWILGGEGRDEANGEGFLNDLWKYSIATNNWTWVKGDKLINILGVYGTAGTPAIANKPGSRARMYTWKDPSGLLWLYGGDGYGSATTGLLYDLWNFNTTSNQWTWMKGDGSVNVASVYGTQGTSSPTTRPGSRKGGVTFVDPAGNLWLLGGNGYPASGGPDLLNDLWKLGTMIVTPVYGLTLVASRLQSDVVLNWQTEQEINTESFTIERSKDGTNYTEIGSINASGNSNNKQAYTYSDINPLSGTIYYRIKAVSKSGISFSNIVVIRSGEGAIQIFPNPVIDKLNLQVSGINKGSFILISDAAGKKVLEQRLTAIGTVSLSVDVRSLSKGTFYLSVINGTLKQQEQFIKQ